MVQENISITSGIGKGAYLEGSITVIGSWVVEGTHKGDLTVAGTLIVGPQGHITGNVIAKNAEVFGTINGNLTATKSVSLGAGARLNGNLYAAKVNILEGSVFNGKCTMIKRKDIIVDSKTKKVEIVDLSPEEMLTHP
jgi:cytoskeletal protein CcmA (bactofilin family)